MKEIDSAAALKLDKTHRWFWKINIQGETDKAFKVRMQNNNGATATFWFPKSRVLFQVIPDPNPGREGQTLTKFFIPNFFTK